MLGYYAGDLKRMFENGMLEAKELRPLRAMPGAISTLWPWKLGVEPARFIGSLAAEDGSIRRLSYHGIRRMEKRNECFPK
jgi:hypothetical protein